MLLMVFGIYFVEGSSISTFFDLEIPYLSASSSPIKHMCKETYP